MSASPPVVDDACVLECPTVTLKPRRAEPFFGGHPWVFSGAIARIEGTPPVGAIVAVRSDQGEFIAYGLINPQSNIAVRLYSWEPAVPPDASFWRARIAHAVALRRDILNLWQLGSACRVLSSEADGISGLTVDRYDRWLLVQITSAALAAHREIILEALRDVAEPAGIWLRTEKGIKEAEGLEIEDGLLWGEPPPRPLVIHEHELQYGIDVQEGQKTGFFLDQRENRRQAARYLAGRKVLDVCCYAAGFTLNALRHGGATHVHAIDVSESALLLARSNCERNGLADRVTFEKGDAFKTLERLGEAGERYGGIILDPPKLARQARGLPEALRGYHSLNRLAVEVLEPGGILVTCSCTGLVSAEMFTGMLREVAQSTGRNIQVLEQRGPAPDHPVSVLCPESNYLKCCICRVE